MSTSDDASGSESPQGDGAGAEARQSCRGKHVPACPTSLLCACRREDCSEEDALAAMREQEDKAVLEVNAEGVKEMDDGQRIIGTALVWAAFRNWLRLAAALLGRGAEVDKATDIGSTALGFSSQEGHVEMTRLLLDGGAGVNEARNDGATALCFSSQDGHVKVVRLLLERGAEVDKADNEGTTPLQISSFEGHVEVVRVLLDKGAEIDKAANDGTTPLFISSQEGCVEVVRLLLDKGAEIDKAANDDWTPLLAGCQDDHVEVVRLLLQNGAEVDKADNEGTTPLLLSCYSGQLKVARLLLAHGAKGNETPKASNKHSEAATSQGHLELRAWLAERVGWPRRKYNCEAGWEAWSPYSHMLWPEHHRRGVILMLLVESRLRKTGKDVMLHILSFCSWSWFEVSTGAAGEEGMLAVEEGEEDGVGEEGEESIGARVKRRKLHSHQPS